MPIEPAPPGGLGALLAAGTLALPKALAKLIDTVGDQIGFFMEPIHTRRKADADAYEAVAKAGVAERIKVMKVGTRQLIGEIEERAEQRRRSTAVRQQQNVEAVTVHAAKELSATEGSASDIPVDPDWVSGFLGHCQEV